MRNLCTVWEKIWWPPVKKQTFEQKVLIISLGVFNKSYPLSWWDEVQKAECFQGLTFSQILCHI